MNDVPILQLMVPKVGGVVETLSATVTVTPHKKGAHKGGGSDVATVKSIIKPTEKFVDGIHATGLTNETECLSHRIDPKTGTCLGEKTLKIISTVVATDGGGNPNSNTKRNPIVDKALKATGCGNSETCMLSNIFAKMVDKKLIKEAIAEDIGNLQQFGPSDEPKWLDNVNIDETLAQRAHEFQDFYPYKFCMRDFAKHGQSLVDPRQSLEKVLDGDVDVPQGIGRPSVRRKSRRMACVLNTDTTSGRGKHWVCVFIDCSAGSDGIASCDGVKNKKQSNEPWTIEYFNSSGNPAFEEILEWMYKAKTQLEQYLKKHPELGQRAVEIIDFNQHHQESKTECGMYCLFYIRVRLCGRRSWQDFKNKKVHDDIPLTLRGHVFAKRNLLPLIA